jgi:tetratricopeptide (TPR) repeat protein
LAAVLGVSAASVAIGTWVFGDGTATKPPAVARPAGMAAMEELARTRFTNQPTLTFTTKGGETLFAWQVMPVLAATPDRPRDILIMVDTSASQAGKPITMARQIISGLANAANADDRVSVWTANLNSERDTHALTNGFQPAGGDGIRTAVSRLADTEYGAGATDLKAALERVTKTFENRPGCQQILLFLGDGASTATPTPINEATRVALGRDLDRNGIQFFAVPLGLHIQANNIHGLSALTGGAVVRLNDDLAAQHGQSTFAEKLKSAFAVPVLRAEKATYGDEVSEVFPSSLPPLRADRATLVVGKLSGPAKAVSLKIDGTVAGRKTDVALSERLPASQADYYFLHPMIEQWRNSAVKDAPAILAADRTLALAAQQYRLYKDEFLVQGEWAVSTGRLDQADKLFQAAENIDPSDTDAVSGRKVVEQMRAGKVTLNQIRKSLSAQTSGTRLGADGSATKVVLRTIAEQDAKPPVGGAAPPPAQNDLLRDAQARRAIQEDQFKVLVDDTIRKARQLQITDPDAAYEDLKRQRESVLANDQIGDRVRNQLALQLEAQMRDVQTKGAETKRRVAEERERIARARFQISETERVLDQEVRTQARIDQFKQLMNKARYELAQQEAEVMRQERIAQGQTIPPEVLASYTIGQRATNLREHRELVRIREDRFLLTLMQVEKSSIPYPDEPPVHFPPAAIWRELTANRVIKYGSQSLGSEVPQSLRDLQNTLENKRVKFEELPSNVPLREILDNLSKQFNVNFIVLEEAFKAEGVEGLLEKKPNVNQKLNGLTLRSFLDIILTGVNATYVVRPEYIEITTVNRRLEEKVTTVFPVADLIIPIPQSVNQQQLFQNLQLQGQQLAIFGQALGAANFLGGLGGGFQGGIQGGIGGLGVAGGGQLGLGGGLGAGGGGQLGQLGALGQQGQGFGGNQGAGGGILGTTGGQLGQFGNLGGQFGLQGGDQSGLLLQIIIETVARGEWTTPNSQQLQQLKGNNQGDDAIEEILPKKQLNSLGYYPPARALIVRGTGLYHSNSSYKLPKADLGANGGPGLPRKGLFAAKPNGQAVPVGTPPDKLAAADGKPDQPRIVNPKEDPVVLAKSVDRQADKMWQEALNLSHVTDPGLIVACADFMMEHKAPIHAVELLKANLRVGVANDAWAHSALALALKVGGGSADEIMRAEMSGIDLDPTDPKAFLTAANAAGDNNRFDLALAYLKRAAALEPNAPAPYTNALALAVRSDGVTSDVVDWAATNLFSRDWPNDGVDVRQLAKDRLAALAKKYSNTPRKAEIDQLILQATKPKRDLVIELRYQGKAVDLDLVVAEPTGGIASATAKRTSGGGVLVGDILETNDDQKEVYTAAQAFSGTYLASVKQILGRPIGNKATLVVTKFAGTDHQVMETYSVDLANPRPVEITLDGGARTELASIPADNNADRTLTTAAPLSTAPTGMSGGTGSATSSVLNANAGSRTASALPAVVPPVETRIPGVSPSAPGLRVEQALTPDRTATKLTISPVFASRGSVATPKIGLLPGGGD